MKRLFLFFLLLVAVYIAKPYWEEPVSRYVNLSFLDPIDEKFENVVNKGSIESTIDSLRTSTQDLVGIISSKTERLRDAKQPVDKPTLAQPTASPISVNNLEIGDSSEQVTAELGEPKSQSINEYGTEWLTFHTDYQNFVMVSFDESNRVGALYTNDDLLSSTIGVTYGAEKADVRKALGQPLTKMRKGLNLFVLQEDEGMDLFKIEDVYAYVFYDLHQNSQVTAVELVSVALENKKKSLYADRSEALRNGFERQLFDLTNAARVRHGRSILDWDNAVAGTGRKHSTDMAENDYFAHDNLQGLSPFDRIKDDGIRFKRAGENLAYGQSSSIFAHEGLMNSKGHRENILLKDYSSLGVGVSFNKDMQPYFSEEFLLR
ncbi:CAP domain-containing protein [Sporosarcina aquimarina]|uniref:CAP-associated domain-containing protein n=1 Tax=Sporosarcina aquimarina TaxID=114975 RepID=A0ABU4FZC4_9BACL|nr:CAP-associated domain-containing protein [Sporosarcina aquimarina]MDW0110073.1 CAP-associated domain-containing protein [Sporosarcina aquimarina]